MKVQVLFFGAAADIVGKREIEFSLQTETKAREAFAKVLEAYPQIQQRFEKSLLFAVNQEYASGDEIIQNGDELAVFPPVSGG